MSKAEGGPELSINSIAANDAPNSVPVSAGPIGHRTTFAAYRSQHIQPPVDRNPDTQMTNEQKKKECYDRFTDFVSYSIIAGVCIGMPLSH